MPQPMYTGPFTKKELLIAEGKTIKNKQEILDLLQAIWLPQVIAIIHCPGHQKGEGQVAQGNNKADLAAKEAALAEAPKALVAAKPPHSCYFSHLTGSTRVHSERSV